ncbi:hypothetical protein DFH06DRAFT_1293940 [Mycena polygramma]|nr:hypothetical protein DFH06DRAFT_1293940 [Mycena polygramma]
MPDVRPDTMISHEPPWLQIPPPRMYSCLSLMSDKHPPRAPLWWRHHYPVISALLGIRHEAEINNRAIRRPRTGPGGTWNVIIPPASCTALKVPMPKKLLILDGFPRNFLNGKGFRRKPGFQIELSSMSG